jgi:hypothetical protein
MVHQGQNFFPIANVIPTATGYFMDVQGEVWSERAKRGTLTKLAGSTTASGRYVTLQTNSRFGQSYRYDQLTRLCQNHPQWKVLGMSGATIPVVVAKTDLATAMGLKPAVLPSVIKQMATSAIARHQATQAAVAKTDTRHHASSVDVGIKARGWIIGTVDEGALTFGLKPAIHTVEDSVDGEIDRLAKLRPGQKFVKLQIQGAVTAGAVVWE